MDRAAQIIDELYDIIRLAIRIYRMVEDEGNVKVYTGTQEDKA